MINPKYDPNNYTKHSPIIIYADYQQIDKLFRSYLLLIKWKVHGTSKALDSASNVGIIRQLVETPLGKEVPKDFQLQVSKVNEVYTQFLSLSPDWEYQLSILNPVGIAKTSIEIWEYNQPQSFINMPWQSSENSPTTDLTPLITATAANATAIAGLSTAIAAQPNAIANALASDDTNVLDPVTSVVGTVPVLLSAANDNNQGLLINNIGTTKIRLWSRDSLLPNSTLYSADGYFFEMPGKGVYEVPDPFYKANVYAISNAAGGNVTVTRSVAV
jgi:hypothetical protein